MERNPKRLDTTLGELIAAASEVAFEYSDNDRDAYRMAQIALVEILRKSSNPIDLENDYGSMRPNKIYLN